jgi:predicted RND superfamily exporter protein
MCAPRLLAVDVPDATVYARGPSLEHRLAASPPNPAPDTLLTRYCRFLTRRARLVLIVAAALFMGSVAVARHLELHTDFAELLPSDDPGVVALHKMSARIGDMTLLLIGVRSPDRAASIRYAEAITNRLRALPPRVCALATYNVRDIRDFFKRNQWLYVGENELTEIHDRLKHEISKRKNPLIADLGLDDEPVDDLRKRLTGKDPLDGRFPDGVFSDREGKYVWIAALPPGGLFGENAGGNLHRAAEEIIRTTNPKSFHPQMEALVTGPVATAIANRAAIERDILSVTVICACLVALSIGLYFRRFRAVPIIGVPAVLGTVMAFAAAELAFGYVNSSTAFLGSIILGNGINYSIILMARYQEERAAGHDVETSIIQAVSGVLAGTAIAAICASASYASLMMTSFRGFFQFGVMGAIGVLCCWVATMTILPAVLFLSDRNNTSPRARRAPLSLGFLGALLRRHTTRILVASAVFTVLAGMGLKHFTKDTFEYDFRKLSARVEVSKTTREFEDNQGSLFGRWPNPNILLADKLEEVELMRQAIRRQDAAAPGPDVIGQIVTIWDVLPGTPEVQARKLDLIHAINKLKHDKALELASAEDRKQIAEINPPDDLRVLTPNDLPPLARRPFTEADGSIGRVLLMYPVEQGLSVWNGRDLLRIANVVQHLYIPEENKTIDTSGSAVVFAAMIRSVLQDGPKATLASLAAVVALILLVMRPARSAFTAIATVLLGIFWMIGAAGFAEVKVTFLNFIALPITFGIGAEYAINIVSRQRESRDMVQAVMSTGSAVALCSWTTIVGYGSLLAARNRALQGFGAMAILGEVACLLTAILALPSLIIWLRKRAS